jgi:hypothetical protein
VGERLEEGVVTICRRLDERKSVCGETLPVSLFSIKTAAFVGLDKRSYIPVTVWTSTRQVHRTITCQMPEFEIGEVDERTVSRKAK